MTKNNAFVIVSALLLKQSEGEILLSEAVVNELNNVLRRKKFNKYITEEERLQFLATLIHEATLIEVTVSITDCRDIKDNKFLELAVSGDEDLLVLNPFRNIPILNPRTFLEQKFNSD